MVREPPDFNRERRAGPQMVMLPPSTNSMCAWPDLTFTSLPLRKTVLTWPFAVFTLMGRCTDIASPSMAPTVSASGGSSAVAAQRQATEAERRHATQNNVAKRHWSPNIQRYAKRINSFTHSRRTSPLYYMQMETTENPSGETREAI